VPLTLESISSSDLRMAKGPCDCDLEATVT